MPRDRQEYLGYHGLGRGPAPPGRAWEVTTVLVPSPYVSLPVAGGDDHVATMAELPYPTRHQALYKHVLDMLTLLGREAANFELGNVDRFADMWRVKLEEQASVPSPYPDRDPHPLKHPFGLYATTAWMSEDAYLALRQETAALGEEVAAWREGRGDPDVYLEWEAALAPTAPPPSDNDGWGSPPGDSPGGGPSAWAGEPLDATPSPSGSPRERPPAQLGGGGPACPQVA